MSSPSRKQLELFEALHNSRQVAFETFNNRSFRGIWSSIIDKYPETAHFIYELLQNADDAEATQVQIVLRNNELLFKHNGKIHFDITEEEAEEVGDINSITGIGDSTKAENQNKIGKFGVGFKAVFQYTDTPEVYDDTFKFKIENYIIPTLIGKDHKERKRGETLFVFPLNKNRESSFNDIKERLENLQNPILFLRNLENVKWQIELSNKVVNKGEYKKKVIETIQLGKFLKFNKIKLYDNDRASVLFLFSEEIIVPIDGINTEHVINVGYFYDESKKKIETKSRHYVNCFFPTKEPLDTCFLVHAPFLLTDNRQNLKPNEPLNNSLISLLANLSAESLVHLRDYGIKNKHLLINKNIVDFIPEDKTDYYGRSIQPLLIPFIDAIEKKISEEKLLLSRSGNKYIACSDAYIADPPELLTLINPMDFVHIKQYDEDDDEWYDKDFLKKDVAEAISECDYNCFLDVETYTLTDLLSDIDADFLEQKPLEWVVKFYACIKKNIKINKWKVGVKLDPSNQILYKAYIIKTSRNHWLSFLNKNGHPQVFFSPKSTRGLNYSFVSPEYQKNEDAYAFLESMGMREPDEKDYIYTELLPKYDGDKIDASEEEIEAHFERFLSYFLKIKGTDDEIEYINTLKSKLFLKSEYLFRRAEALYEKSDILDTYFDNNYHWVDKNYYNQAIDTYGEDAYSEFLCKLGVRRFPRIIPKYYINKSIWESENILRAGLFDNIPNWESRVNDVSLDGFNSACHHKHIPLELSVAIWKVVIPEIIQGNPSCKVQYRGYRQRNWRYLQYQATIIFELQNLPWIYNADGVLVSAKNISIEELHPIYERDQRVISFLMIEDRVKSIIELGGTMKQDEQQRNGKWMEDVAKAKGMTVEELKKIMDAIPNKEVKSVVDNDEIDIEEQEPKRKTNDKEKEKKRDIKTRLMEEWEDKGKKIVKHPHSSSDSRPEIQDTVFTNNLSLEDQPLFDDELEDISDNRQKKSKTNKTESALKAQNTSALEEAEKAEEQIQIYDWFLNTPKYTFLWFKLLMALNNNESKKPNKRQIEIDFLEWEMTNSDKILHLSNPNRPVPTWATDSSFIVTAIGEKSHKIQGIIARVEQGNIDIAIDMAEDVKGFCDIAKIIRVVLEDDTNIIDSLENRFIQLGYDDDFDMNENLTKEIEFIYGPPGTGKTTKLVKRLHNIVINRDKVNILVLTPTNKAADVIAKKMVDDEECYACLTRFGATESLYLIEDAAVVMNRADTDLDLLDKNIIVTTAARYAYDYLQPDNTFICDVNWDYIIIDEASMIDLVTITYVLYKGKESKFIISGDPKQIPPVSQNNIPAYNIYDMVGLNDFKSAINEYKRFIVTALKTQYRSIPVIGNAVSKFAYNGMLENWDGRTAPKPLKLDGLKIKHFNFVGFDTAEFDPIMELGAIGKSAFHLYSVIFTYNMVKYAASQIHEKYEGTDYSIGVVCPYKAQASAIQQMLESSPVDAPNCHVSCGTVHGFQGDECDIMFVVLNPPANCSEDAHVNEEYIINVGISRARDYLFVLLPKGQTKGFYRKRELGTLVSPNDRADLDCKDIEEVIFGSSNYIYSNTHVTCHMPVNVYCEENAEYEVKIGDDALDIKINK